MSDTLHKWNTIAEGVIRLRVPTGWLYRTQNTAGLWGPEVFVPDFVELAHTLRDMLDGTVIECVTGPSFGTWRISPLYPPADEPPEAT